jgi:Ulp1 family protease
MAELKGDELMLNYNDVCIYGRDYKLLLSPSAWLNDTCIQYQLVRLQEEYRAQRPQLHPLDTVLLDPTVVSYFMHQCETDEELLTDFLPGYQMFAHTKRIFVPINDCLTSQLSQSVGKGTHWSLLVVHIDKHHADSSESTAPLTDCPPPPPPPLEQRHCPPQLEGFHYDSVPHSRNQTVAAIVAGKLVYTLQLLYHQQHSSTTTVDGKDAKSPTNHRDSTPSLRVAECNAPLQRNGFDCGLHVLAAAQVLLLHDSPNENECQEAAGESATMNGEERLRTLFDNRPSYALELRQSMVQDIQQRARKTI